MGTAVDQIFSDLQLEEGGQNTVLATHQAVDSLFSFVFILEKSLASFHIDDIAPSLLFSLPACSRRTLFILDSISFCIICC